ncbi:low molecular weight phosphatase family protein [Algoriphagus pacificus]|uniref:Protein-tyrosine-phosphatase n=1 Tax=Algoriphagus pacificus TaxID=2811234 RepID=A0ABS3CFW3_9BACT|nr:protein-tyrosine-phosphatase [Algoriphagus pacificus]MBN7815990.1 protein-tyrosine-phosphatase [Algoriphagus pacificus]
MHLFPEIDHTFKSFRKRAISAERKSLLEPIIEYMVTQISKEKIAKLNFICTHNSRRSQFSQIWAQVAAYYFNLPVESYSGGVEVTEFNARAVEALQRAGFEIKSTGDNNPIYELSFAKKEKPIVAFSKVFDDESNPKSSFAAIMTCDHADETCPFIPGCEARIPLRFEDPKKFDETPLESKMYSERSQEIASELFFAFEQVQKLVKK